MNAGLVFIISRILQILSLIPIWGILSYFINLYTPYGAIPPSTILVLFIISLFATLYALPTFLQHHSRSFLPLYISIVDILFFGALIAGVVVLAPAVENRDCVAYQSPRVAYNYDGSVAWSGSWVRADKQCVLLKAAWGLGILNVILFFFSAVAAAAVYRGVSGVRTVRVERSHHRRHARPRHVYV